MRETDSGGSAVDGSGGMTDSIDAKDRYRRKVVKTTIENECSFNPTVWRELACGHHIAEPKNKAFKKFPDHETPKPARSRICEQCKAEFWKKGLIQYGR